jgi:hypothetical protein
MCALPLALCFQSGRLAPLLFYTLCLGVSNVLNSTAQFDFSECHILIDNPLCFYPHSLHVEPMSLAIRTMFHSTPIVSLNTPGD